MIQMHSNQEAVIFGICFCLLVSVILLIYLLYNFIESILIDRIYTIQRKKALRTLNKALRQIRREKADKYSDDLEYLYNLIKEGDNIE